MSDEHELLRQTVRQFTATRVEPQAMAHDQAGTFNTALLRELGKLGLIGITIPESDGGANLDATAACIVHDELAYSDPGFTLGYLAHALLFVNNFYWAGNPTLRRKYLPKVWRSCAQRTMTSTQRRAMPTDIAARPSRSISRLRIMFVMPPPSLPTRFSAGMRQLSNTSSDIVDARMPIFGIFSSVEKPGNVRSTTKLVTLPSTAA